MKCHVAIIIILTIFSCKNNQDKAVTVPVDFIEEESKLEIIDHSDANAKRMQLVKNGERLPDLALLDVRGKPIDLTSIKGKTLVLNFWASWCTPCVEYMPDYQNLINESSGTDIEYVAISIDDEMSYWKDFIEERDWTDHSYWLGMKEREPLFAFTYSKIETEDFNSILVALPKYVIISSDGVILNNNASHPSSEEFKAELSTMLTSL